MRIASQIATPDRARAAELYWQAFGGKLGKLLGPDDRALSLITRVMRLDHGLAAYDGDRLVGIAGFKTPEGALVDGALADFAATYGPVSGPLRALLLGLLERDIDNTNFLLDGICVDQTARGMGVGSALLDALEQLARARGYSAVRLEVIDANPRARALYLRQGYQPQGTSQLGILRHLFGFAASTTMIKTLDARA